MQRGIAIPLLAALALAAACAAREPDDFVLYKPPPGTVDGRVAARSLTVTESPGALLVTRVFDRGVRVATGPVPKETWEDLRTRLVPVRYLPKTASSPRDDPETFQIYAHLGRVVIDVTRDPEAPVETELEDVRERLESLAASLEPAEDRVAAVAPFLGSHEARVRGQAVLVLLLIRGDEREPKDVRLAAERALQRHVRTETDPEILARIRER